MERKETGERKKNKGTGRNTVKRRREKKTRVDKKGYKTKQIAPIKQIG